MTQCNKLNVKLSNSQLNKLKSAIKNGTEVTLNISSNLIGNSNDETNYPNKLLLPDTQISKIRKAFTTNSSANIRFPKFPNKKMTSLANQITNSFIKELKNAGTKKLNNDILVDAGLDTVGKKIKIGISTITGSAITLTNNEIKDIIKVIKSLEKGGILLKGTTTKITSHEGGFLNFLRPVMTAVSPLMKSVLTPSAKSVSLP